MTANTFTATKHQQQYGVTFAVMFEGRGMETYETLIKFGDYDGKRDCRGHAWGVFDLRTLRTAFIMLSAAFGATVAIERHCDFARYLAQISADNWTMTKDELRQILEARVTTSHIDAAASAPEISGAGFDDDDDEEGDARRRRAMVRDDGPDASAITDTFSFRRGCADIHHKADEDYAQLLARPEFAGASELPEVINYMEIRKKGDGVSAALQKIELELKQMDLDEEKTKLNLDGDKLAKKLADIEAKRNALTAQVGPVRRGGEIFARDVQHAKEVAVMALERHLVASAALIKQMANSQLVSANAGLESHQALFPVMDQAAVARRLNELAAKAPGLRERIFSVLEATS